MTAQLLPCKKCRATPSCYETADPVRDLKFMVFCGTPHCLVAPAAATREAAVAAWNQECGEQPRRTGMNPALGMPYGDFKPRASFSSWLSYPVRPFLEHSAPAKRAVDSLIDHAKETLTDLELHQALARARQEGRDPKRFELKITLVLE